MPDASRLVAALSLAFLAFIVSGQIMPLMTEGMDFGWFTYVNVAIGLAIGWVVMGDRAGRGMTNAVNNGLTGMVVMVFWALFIQGGYEMMRRAMRNQTASSGVMNGFPLFISATLISRSGSAQASTLVKPR